MPWKEQNMTPKLLGVVSVLAVTPIWAASSGNFTARVATTQCEINGQNGSLSGGLTNKLLSTTIQTPAAGSTALLIRPSLVTGLFTRTKVDDINTTATSIAGVKVRVLIDGKVVAPGVSVGAVAGVNDGWIYFDKRFQQLSTNVTSFLGTACDDPITPLIEPCFIQLILSTLNANSFDFVVGDVGVGAHTLTVEWDFETTGAPGDAAACVGPGLLTVTQVKTFSTGSGIVITDNN